MSDIPPAGQPVPPAGSTPPIGGPPGDSYSGPAPDNNATTLAMLAHLLGIVGPLGPLIIWLIKKDQEPFVSDQAREALNFELTVFIVWLAIFVTTFILCFAWLLYPVLFVVNLVMCVIASMQANSGVAYRYPVNLRFIK